MVKLMFLCRRRPELSHDQYRQRLLVGHVPLALRHHPTLCQYIVNIVEHERTGGVSLDSIGELWFETLEQFYERLYDSEDGQRIIEHDVAGFIGSADAYVVREHVHRTPLRSGASGTASPGVKLLCGLRRPADFSHDQFVEHWLERHAALVLRHHPGITGYVANEVVNQLSPGADALDGIAELHFGSPADLGERMFDSPEGERIVREDIARFIADVRAYHVCEYVEKLA